ncbi:hypothetical protein A3J02_01940 [Candidatus Azambacteria bacterium RIFCSPLOWO2_02_FULL_46_11]|uniref:Uncharacterized protein n=1 Tax=Candidatus Azambacteria bacterium RIFCSPLOWO2_02_FULL_46_11 TaxID=1797300 RepID=A0A1F5CQY3_9BACT|nr:MAG: hypothetical protein A3J02_01940 [Candidatus Azambacteria bacterium RIFCSPLOWO2_02_FULL_46_11]
MERILRKIIEFYVLTKWRILGNYYKGLLVQAEFLYRQSPLFRERWLTMGLEYAEMSFENEAQHFFYKAKQEPMLIKARIFWDSLLGRPVQTYYISEN